MKICILSLMIFFILARSVEGHEPLWCLCGETTTWEEDGYTEVKLKKTITHYCTCFKIMLYVKVLTFLL